MKKPILHIFCVLVLAVATSGCGHKADPAVLMEKAKKLEGTGDLNGALIELKNAAQASSENRDVRLQLGRLYLTMENYPSAEKELTRARQYGMSSATTDPLIAEALMGQQAYQRLIDELPLPDSKSPAYPALLARRASALIALHRTGDAAKLIEQANASQLKSPLIQLAAASLAITNKKVDEAFNEVEEGLKLDPRQTDLLLFKAGLLNATGKKDEAIALYKSILEINPRQQSAQIALIHDAIDKGQYDEARQATNRLIKNSQQNFPARFLLALIDFKQHKLNDTLDHIAPVINAAPDYLPALFLSGAAEFGLGNLETAYNHLAAVIKAAPNHVAARRLLAATQLRMGQADDAAQTLAPLNPQGSSDPGTLIIAGEIALARHQFSQAEDYFSKAKHIDPNSAGIRTELGLARLGQGDEKGLTDLEGAAAMQEGGQRAAVLLTIAQLRQGQFDAALKSAAQLAQKEPDNPLPVFLSGTAYFGMKDVANARKYFELALSKKASYFPAAAALADMDFKDGQIKSAQGRFDKVLVADPKNTKAMIAEAVLALKSGQPHKYLEWLNKAAQTDTRAFKPRALIAQYYLSKQDYANALSAARDANTARPDSLQAMELLGTTQVAAGEIDNAIATFTKLADMKPGSAEALFQLAKVQLAAKRDAAARVNLEKAVKLDTDFIDAEFTLANLYARTGSIENAMKLAQQIQNRHPDQASGFLLEGDIQMLAGKPEAALIAYRQAAAKQANGLFAIRQQQALEALGHATEGEAQLSNWLKQHPDDLPVHVQYASVLLAHGKYLPAAEQYKYIVAKAPNNLMILNNMAFALAQAKDPNAVPTAKQALKLAPDDPSVLDTLGWALAQTGRPAEGIPYLQKALSKKPDDGDIDYHYAAALALGGDKIRAQRELKQLLSSGISFSQENEARALLKSLQ